MFMIQNTQHVFMWWNISIRIWWRLAFQKRHFHCSLKKCLISHLIHTKQAHTFWKQGGPASISLRARLLLHYYFTSYWISLQPTCINGRVTFINESWFNKKKRLFLPDESLNSSWAFCSRIIYWFIYWFVKEGDVILCHARHLKLHYLQYSTSLLFNQTTFCCVFSCW